LTEYRHKTRNQSQVSHPKVTKEKELCKAPQPRRHRKGKKEYLSTFYLLSLLYSFLPSFIHSFLQTTYPQLFLLLVFLVNELKKKRKGRLFFAMRKRGEEERTRG